MRVDEFCVISSINTGKHVFALFVNFYWTIETFALSGRTTWRRLS